MTDRVLSFISLARKAGKLTVGFDVTAAAAMQGKAKLILLASDLSRGTAARLEHRLELTETPLLVT